MCGRQGQPAAGTVAGGDKDRAGQRMCGAATGRGDNRGNRIRTGRDVVCAGGWREGQQPERRVRPMMRFAVRVGGGMRCGGRTHAQLPGIRTDGETRESRGRRTGRGRFGEALRQGWNGPRDPRFPGRAMCPNRAGNGGRGLVRGIGFWKNGSAPARVRRPGRDVVTGFGPDAGMRRPGPHTGVGHARAVIACKP